MSALPSTSPLPPLRLAQDDGDPGRSKFTKRYTLTQLAEMADAFLRGDKVVVVALRWRCSTFTVYRALRRFGVPRRPYVRVRPPAEPRMNGRTVRELVRDFSPSERERWMEIANDAPHPTPRQG